MCDGGFVVFGSDCGRLDDLVFVVPVAHHHVVLYLESLALSVSCDWICQFGFGARIVDYCAIRHEP